MHILTYYQKVTASINQIITILDNIVKLNNAHESKYSVAWNVEQIKVAFSHIVEGS